MQNKDETSMCLQENQNSPFQSFKEEAIPFILVNKETRLFEINPEAAEMLKSVATDRPLAIVAVAGMYRTGKSYLLNRVLLDRSDGFGVGPSINPCTKGLWLWGKPINGKTTDGTEVQVLVIDTEGLGAYDETQNHDARVFSLAILLSSSFVYNSMGTIDENALQQLSLVVHISSNIQLRSQASSEDELASIFPSFMWVVRDFALQLVDQTGAPISQQEYFEKSLQELKGDSEAIRAKNKIRVQIRKFFKDRDCCTLIRPLADERLLQNLSKLSCEELRPEFLDQVKTIRQKVLQCIKPKELNGRELTGAMLANLACQYVQAINNGSVPNIESAWSYISKQESQNALDASLALFEAQLGSLPLPISEEALDARLSSASTEAVLLFKERTRSMLVEGYFCKLQDEIEKCKDVLKKINAHKFEQAFTQFTKQKYIDIKKALKNDQFESFSDYQEQLEAFKQYLYTEAPQGPTVRRVIVIEEFVTKQLTSTSKQWIANLINEHKLTIQKSQLSIQTLETENADIKKELKETQMSMQAKIDELHTELTKAKQKELILSEQFKSYQEEQEIKINRLGADYAEQLVALEEHLTCLQQVVADREDALAEAQKTIHHMKSELEMTLALSTQKCGFLEAQILQKVEAEKTMVAEHGKLISCYQEQLRDQSNDYEAKLRSIQNQFADLEDRLSDSSEQLAKQQQLYSAEKAAWQERERFIKDEVAQLQTELLQKVDKKEVERKQEQLNQLQSSFNDLKVSLQVQLQQHNAEIQKSKDERDFVVTRLEKDIAILKQSVEFKDSTLKELAKTLEEKQKTIKRQSKQIEECEKQFTEEEERHNKEIRDVSEELQTMLEKVRDEMGEAKIQHEAVVETYVLELQEAQAAVQAASLKSEREITSLQADVESLTAAKQRLEESLKTQADCKRQELAQLSHESTTKIQDLTTELEETTRNSEEQVQRIQQSAEESLAKLRSFFDSEKERLMTRSADEKSALKKQMVNLQEDFERQLADEQLRHDEESNQLQIELQSCQQTLAKLRSQYDHFAQVSTQKLETVTQQLKERETEIKKEQEMSETLRTKLQLAEEEAAHAAEDMQQRIDELGLSKTKEMATARNQLLGLQSELSMVKQQLKEARDELQDNEAASEQKVASLKTEMQSCLDSALLAQQKQEQENALLKQENCFYQSKVEDLKATLEVTMTKYKDQLELLKQDALNQYAQQTVKIADQKKEIEKKYEDKIKSLKESHLAAQKQITELERDLSQAEEKLISGETNYQAQLEKVVAEIRALKELNSNGQELHDQEKERLQTELDQFKNKSALLEQTAADLQLTLERERILQESKVKFLEQQRDSAKMDMAEQTRKLEEAYNSVSSQNERQKKKDVAKEKLKQESDERKHKAQAEHAQDLASKLGVVTQKLSQTENALRDKTAKLQVMERELAVAQKNVDKRVSEYTEKEKQLQQTISEATKLHETKQESVINQLMKDKEQLKQRLSDSEKHSKDIESRRNAMLFDFERERAQLTSELAKLKTKYAEGKELLENAERKSNLLQREVEKLRTSSINGQKSVKMPFALSTITNIDQTPRSNGITPRTQSAAAGGLTSRTERPSTVKLQFGKPKPLPTAVVQIGQSLQEKREKENERFVMSPQQILPDKRETTGQDEKKSLFVRSSLLNVSTPFKQQQLNVSQLSQNSAQPQRGLLKTKFNLNLSMVVNDQLKEENQDRKQFMM